MPMMARSRAGKGWRLCAKHSAFRRSDAVSLLRSFSTQVPTDQV